MDLTTAKKMLASHRAVLKQKYNVKSLGIFGSYVRGEQTKKSDLDVLVEFSETPSLLDFVGMKNELAQLMGVKVDLVMKSSLRRHLAPTILREVVAV
jgi:predicted nucleotidyltransferase